MMCEHQRQPGLLSSSLTSCSEMRQALAGGYSRVTVTEPGSSGERVSSLLIRQLPRDCGSLGAGNAQISFVQTLKKYLFSLQTQREKGEKC